jgi:molybdopterin-binding protein
MKISARNALKGIIKAVNIGSINDEIILEISPGIEVISVITKSSAENLGLAVGKEAYAVIKASDVMVATE